VRWGNLTVDEDEQRRLPGYRDEAVVRRFDAPEALETRFYEVRARSVLNRVPTKSRMPFRWTINPFRGCSHACAYCLGPETRILMADGGTRPIAELQIGDAIFGTVGDGGDRRLARTEVLDKWSSVRSACAVGTSDKGELITSAEHRFLAVDGWTHVMQGTEHPARPHLHVGTGLLGPRDEQAIEGARIESDSVARVTSLRRLGVDMRLYDITTVSGDFIANGVVSHNCFARPTHKYLDFDAGRDFEREIIVKVNAPEVLRVELARPSWKHEHIALGTNTDPYQWVEGRYRLMEGIWEALRDAANPCSVLTKSPLLLRDMKLMLEISERTSISACLSIPTLDEKAWRATEPHTPNPRARLEAVAELNRAGIPTGVLIAPLMPGINDAPEQVEPLLAAATQAGASSIGGIALHLRAGVREVFMEWLGSQRPDLIERYERLYSRGAYLPYEERERLASLVRRGKSPLGFRGSRAVAKQTPTRTERTPASESPQEKLF